jgi:DNA-binding GntR family transcriptional regulator
MKTKRGLSSRPRREAGSLVQRAYAEIKRRILDNEYPPGYRALEPELASALGMSRTPVREALIRLQEEGLVEMVPRRGMRVLPLSPDDMLQIYQVLTSLESEAAGLLARRHPSAEDLAPLALAIAEMDAALARNDLPAWADADERFHRALLDRCGNRRLAGLAFTVFDQVHRARLASLPFRPRPWGSNRDHRALLTALRKGDEKRARALHRRHRLRAAEVLLRALEKHAPLDL